MVFQRRQKVQFLVFLFLAWFVVLQVMWSGFSELVSVMGRDLGCSMNTLYEQHESRF
jgi:hypothetical protein